MEEKSREALAQGEQEIINRVAADQPAVTEAPPAYNHVLEQKEAEIYSNVPPKSSSAPAVSTLRMFAM